MEWRVKNAQELIALSTVVYDNTEQTQSCCNIVKEFRLVANYSYNITLYELHIV